MLRRNFVSIVLIATLILPGLPAFAQDPAADPPLAAQEPEAAQEPQAQEEPKTLPPQKPGEIVKPSETASTPSTGRRILSNFWMDQKAMWTSPFHMNSGNAKWWGLFGAGTAALIATDRSTSNALPNTVTQISFSKNFSRIGATYTTLPIAGALYLYGRKTDNAKAREVGVLGAEALLDSAIIVAILKAAAGRERPDLEGGNGRFFKGKDGFPSGHAIETWSFASVIAHEYAPNRIVPVITYSLATAVSVSRFTARKHYASDIAAGGAMGWFIGKFVWDHHLDPNIHKRYDPNAVSRLTPDNISPMFQPGTHTYGVSFAWNK